MKNTRGRFPRGKDGPQDQAGVGINSPEVFQALLRHERNRSDRAGHEFSLAVFDVSGMNHNGKSVQKLTRDIRQTMRSIDELGWIDPQNIAVLLPVTSAEGGRIFSSRVCASIPCTVYTYPQSWLPERGESSAQKNSGRQSRDATVRKVFGREIPIWKNYLDVAGAVVLIALLSPIFLLMAVYIKVVSPGKVLYRQRRVGYRGELFAFLKFRTMHENNNPDAHREYLKELIKSGEPMEKLDGDRDPRIIPGGKLLRKLCLDELPQFFNVLRRDMSLVGPRPCIPYEAEEYLRWHRHRFDTLPGMTGLWQVSGKNKLSFEQMIRLDIAYARRMSLWLDVKILLLTPPAILKMVFEAGMQRIRRQVLPPAPADTPEANKEGASGNA